MFEMVFGKEIADLIFVEIERNPAQMYASPATYLAKIEDMVQEHAAKVGSGSLIFGMVRSLPQLLEMTRDMRSARQQREAELFAEVPAAAVLRDTLIGARRAGHAALLDTVISGIEDFKPEDILLGGPALAHMLERGRSVEESVTFEEQIRGVAAALTDSAERWYLPLLQGALMVTRELDGRSSNVPATVGPAVAQASELWASRFPSLVPLISHEIRIVRNSEAHKNTKIDVRQETVRFVNERQNRSPEVVEFTRETFGEFVGRYINLCLAIGAAFRGAKGSPTV